MARRATQAIERQLLLLETTPDIGRPFSETPGWHELVIAFGDSGYVALYHHDPAARPLRTGVPPSERGGLLRCADVVRWRAVAYFE